MLSAVLLTSGCTKYMSNGKGRVVNEKTQQALTSNILCLPEDKDLQKLYEKNKKYMDVDYKSLKKCSEFTPASLKYNGLWEAIFIRPLAWLIINLGILVKNYGVAVMIIGILIRLILAPFTKKTMVQSENMKKAQPELNDLQRKYGSNPTQESQMAMSQEMMLIYQKYNINPMGSCLVAFIQIPILFAFYEAINRVPVILEGYFLTMQLGTSPALGMSHGNFAYLVVVALIVLTTYLSSKNSMNASTGNKEQDMQQSFMMKFMVVFIGFASLNLPTALALYWIVSNTFMIIQNYVIKKSIEKDNSTKKNKSIPAKPKKNSENLNMEGKKVTEVTPKKKKQKSDKKNDDLDDDKSTEKEEKKTTKKKSKKKAKKKGSK